jgi:tetratricopeptide (TPR) repeat protein
MVHRFVGFHFPAAPTWLNEGLAKYYETMRIEEGKARVGLPPPDAFFRGQHSMVVCTDQGITVMLRDEGTNAPGYALRGEWFAAQGRHDEALVDLHAAVALAPDDFRPSYQLASYLDGRVERKTDPTGALRNELHGLIDRLRENAGSADAWNLIAWYDAGRGQAERGLPFARKAVAADSSCFDCYDTAAVLLHQLGKLGDAVVAERIAVQLMPDGVRVPVMVNRLRAYERELGEAARKE